MLSWTSSIYSQLSSPSPSAHCEQSLWQLSYVGIVTESEDVTGSSPVCAGGCSSQSLPAVLANLRCRIKRTGGSLPVSQEGTTRIRWTQSFHLGILGDLGSSLALFICLKNVAINK